LNYGILTSASGYFDGAGLISNLTIDQGGYIYTVKTISVGGGESSTLLKLDPLSGAPVGQWPLPSSQVMWVVPSCPYLPPLAMGTFATSTGLVVDGKLAGRVTTTDGRPASFAKVAIVPISPVHPQFTVDADENGHFEVDGQQRGKYLVGIGLLAPFDSAEWKSRVYDPGVTSRNRAKVIELGDGEWRTDINFKLPAQRRLVLAADNTHPSSAGSTHYGRAPRFRTSKLDVAASATGLEFHPPKSQRLFMAHCYAKHHDEMISTREALLEKLVVSLHLNVPERRILGSDCVSVDEVAAVVKRLLERNGLDHHTVS